MAPLSIRPAGTADLARLTEIYNHYVERSISTFELEPRTVGDRRAWLAAHATRGPYRVLVGCEEGRVVGYAETSRFRPRPAYDSTVESSVYCAPEAVGRGVGRRLYSALFEAIASEEVHRVVAVIAQPNPASTALHRRFDFREVGMFTEVGRKFDRYWDVVWYERPGAFGAEV